MFKKIISLICVVLLLTATASAATVSWGTEDCSAGSNYIVDPGFESYASGATYGTNGVIDGTAFADTDHKNVLKADNKYVSINSSCVPGKWTTMLNNAKLNVEFDYFTPDANTTLRVEFRGFGLSSDATTAQNPYWEGYQYLNVKPTQNSWSHFKATFDVAKMKEAIAAEGKNFSVSGYIFVAAWDTTANTAKVLNIDNLVIGVPGAVVPLAKPTYDYKWSVDASVANQDGVAGSVYKGTPTITDAGQNVAAVSLKDYTFNEGKYKLSFWFKEDESNEASMSRMWRVYPLGSTSAMVSFIPTNNPSNTYAYYMGFDGKVEKGNWFHVEKEFVVDSTTNSVLLNNNGLDILWNVKSNTNEGWDDSYKNKTFTAYISDLTLVKYPAETTEVMFVTDNKVSAKQGSKSTATMEGYVDLTKEISLEIPDIDATYPATLSNTTTTDDFTSTLLTFDTESINGKTYTGYINAYDIWGRKQSLPVNIEITSDQSYTLDISDATWSENIWTGRDITVPAGTNYINCIDGPSYFNGYIKFLAAQGYTQFKVSFDATGEAGKSYPTNGSIPCVQFRTGNNIELSIRVPAADLAGGETHSYSGTYGLDASTFNEALNTRWQIFFRNSTESTGSVTYSNICVQYMKDNAATPDYVSAKACVKNSAETSFAFGDFLVLATYADADNKVLVDVKTLRLNPDKMTLGKDQERYVELYTPYESGKYYKAFLISSFDELIPRTESVSR